ncbi:MAG: hypothetical protein Q8Q05_00045 [bacterium]|nr:hypothetical protein [bacterium]
MKNGRKVIYAPVQQTLDQARTNKTAVNELIVLRHKHGLSWADDDRVGAARFIAGFWTTLLVAAVWLTWAQLVLWWQVLVVLCLFLVIWCATHVHAKAIARDVGGKELSDIENRLEWKEYLSYWEAGYKRYHIDFGSGGRFVAYLPADDGPIVLEETQLYDVDIADFFGKELEVVSFDFDNDPCRVEVNGECQGVIESVDVNVFLKRSELWDKSKAFTSRLLEQGWIYSLEGKLRSPIEVVMNMVENGLEEVLASDAWRTVDTRFKQLELLHAALSKVQKVVNSSGVLEMTFANLVLSTESSQT